MPLLRHNMPLSPQFTAAIRITPSISLANSRHCGVRSLVSQINYSTQNNSELCALRRKWLRGENKVTHRGGKLVTVRAAWEIEIHKPDLSRIYSCICGKSKTGVTTLCHLQNRLGLYLNIPRSAEKRWRETNKKFSGHISPQIQNKKQILYKENIVNFLPFMYYYFKHITFPILQVIKENSLTQCEI